MKMESFIKVSILNNKHIDYTGKFQQMEAYSFFYNECH